jgi:hypothetical protein
VAELFQPARASVQQGHAGAEAGLPDAGSGIWRAKAEVRQQLKDLAAGAKLKPKRTFRMKNRPPVAPA